MTKNILEHKAAIDAAKAEGKGRGKAKKEEPPKRDPRAPEVLELVQLPQLNIKNVTIPIVGVTPLVVNGWSAKAIQMMRDAQMGAARAKKAPKDPHACFEGAKYKDAKGNDCLKACFFKAAMVAAGRFLDGTNMTLLRMSVFVKGDLLPFEFDECIMHEGMVRNATGVADIRYRPMYSNWRVSFDVEYFANDLSLSQVVELVRQAGMRVGICEGRPEKSPTLGWGRFDIDFERLRGGKIKSELLGG